MLIAKTIQSSVITYYYKTDIKNVLKYLKK